MAPPKAFFLVFLLCVISAVQSVCVPRKTTRLSAPSPSASPESSYFVPETNSPAKSPETNSPANSPSTDTFYPPIYYPPNGQPADSPAPQPNPSDSPAPQPDPCSPESDSPAPQPDTTSPESNPSASNPKPPASPSSKAPTVIPKLESNIVKKICGATDYPAECIQAVNRFHVAGKVDAVTVLGMAIKASTEELKKAEAAADKISSSPTKPTSGDDPDSGDSGPDVCKDSYTDAMDSLNSAVDAIPSKDIGTVNSMLSSAITSFSDCADATSGEDSPLATYNDELKKLVSNSLAIASLIH